MITYKFSGSVENCTDRGINEENSDRNNDDSGSDVRSIDRDDDNVYTALQTFPVFPRN